MERKNNRENRIWGRLEGARLWRGSPALVQWRHHLLLPLKWDLAYLQCSPKFTTDHQNWIMSWGDLFCCLENLSWHLHKHMKEEGE